MTPLEVRGLLDELDRRLGTELAGFWRTIAEADPAQFRTLLVEAYPEIVTPYVAAAADLGTVWYDETPTTTNYRAVPAEPIPVERLTQSALWALNVGTAETGLDLLTGSATRAMYDGMRETVVENVTRERGARWYRHASATACGWCRMIATRHVGDGATFYRSAKAAGDGNRYHDHCHCMAVMIRPGQTPELPSYIEQWNDDYLAARKAGATDPKDIAKAMDNAPTGKTTVTREAREAAKAEKEAGHHMVISVVQGSHPVQAAK